VAHAGLVDREPADRPPRAADRAQTDLDRLQADELLAAALST
jgi:hypothetical protein